MPTFTTSTERQLSSGSPDGTSLGNSASDNISFYGATPIVQPAGNAQAALTRGLVGGTAATYATTQSPLAGGLSVTTTGEFAMTVVSPASAIHKVASADVLVINKPAAQAGLGIGNVRVSGTNSIAVTFSNFTSATITPTASEKYGIVGLRWPSSMVMTPTLTPAAVAGNATSEQTFTVTGVRSGEAVIVMKPTAQTGLDIMGARVSANNQIAINFGNVTAATITPTAGEVYTVMSLGGIDAPSNDILVCANVGTVAAVGGTTATAANSNITVTGLATTDMVSGISKPTYQAGLAIGGGNVTAANTLGVTWLNTSSAGITPTASESYGIRLFRPAPSAPMVLYSATLSPSSVSPNTTAEQGFTVNGLVAGSVVFVNKPANQSGLGIVGYRVSGANALAITFGNLSTATITPTASEVYLVGNFQQAVPDGGSAWVYTASTVDQQQSVLMNAVRTALVNLGLAAGV